MKKLVDILTVLLLAAAFGMAFYTGFIGRKDNGMPRLATNLFAIISIVGTVILLLVGMVSALIARAKNNLVTNSFLAFAVVQSAAVVAIILCMAFVWSGVFALENKTIWAVYIISVLIIIAGYVDAITFSDVLARRDAGTLNTGADRSYDYTPALTDNDDSVSFGNADESAEEETDISDLDALLYSDDK